MLVRWDVCRSSSTCGGGAASTWHGILTVPPNGASVFCGSGCLSKFGLNAVKHYANMPMQYAAIFKGCKNDNFHMKKI